MIAQELSYYPSTYDDEQRMAEQLSRPRGDDFFDAVGLLAVGAVMTAGIVEPASANIENRQAKHTSEATQRTLGGNALFSTIILKENSVDQALDWQLARERATLN